MAKLKISIDRILSFLNRYFLWIIGGIFLLLFIYSAYLYYISVYSLLNDSIELTQTELILDEQVFNQVSENIQQRKELLKEVRINSYTNPFSN